MNNLERKNKRLMMPGFLQRFDEYLLRHHPLQWSARTHFVAYFSLLFAVVIAILSYFNFTDARSYSNIDTWIGFTVLAIFIGFVFWMIFLLRFNIFKRFGNWSPWNGLLSFALYFASIGLMILTAFIPPAIESYRANTQYGNEEIVQDVNEINLNAVRLEYSLLPLEWSTDTVIVRDSVLTDDYSGNMDSDYVVEVDSIEAMTDYREIIDTARLRSRLLEEDSSIKMNDSMYVFFDCPDYVFIYPYNADEYSIIKLLTSKEIYYLAVKNYVKPDREALLKRMRFLKEKYAVNNLYGYDPDPVITKDMTYDRRIQAKYSIGKIDNGTSNIVSKKYRWKEWDGLFRVFFYTTLCLTLLVFIFRHSTARTFFLSLLVVLILMILSALFLGMSDFNENFFFSLLLTYYLLFLLIAISIKASGKRNVIQGIGLNIVLFFTPFLPVFIVAWYYWTRAFDYDTNTPENYIDPFPWLLVAELAGPILLLLLLQPFFVRLYRKWYALPED